MARTIRTIFEFASRAQTGGAQAIRSELDQLADSADDFGDQAEEAGRKSAAAEGGIGKMGEAAKVAKIALAGLAAVGVGAITFAVGQAARDTVAASDAMVLFQARTGSPTARCRATWTRRRRFTRWGWVTASTKWLARWRRRGR